MIKIARIASLATAVGDSANSVQFGLMDERRPLLEPQGSDGGVSGPGVGSNKALASEPELCALSLPDTVGARPDPQLAGLSGNKPTIGMLARHMQFSTSVSKPPQKSRPRRKIRQITDLIESI